MTLPLWQMRSPRWQTDLISRTVFVTDSPSQCNPPAPQPGSREDKTFVISICRVAAKHLQARRIALVRISSLRQRTETNIQEQPGSTAQLGSELLRDFSSSTFIEKSHMCRKMHMYDVISWMNCHRATPASRLTNLLAASQKTLHVPMVCF